MIAALRSARFDVSSIAGARPGIPDADVADTAVSEQRVLVTEDRDFGRLFHARGLHPGVIYLRYPSRAREMLTADVVQLAASSSTMLAGAFVVMQPGRIRISRSITG